MRVSPKARPLTLRELVELRTLARRVRVLLGGLAALGPCVPSAVAARMMGLKPRTVQDLVRAGHFPGAWKPAPNRLHLPVAEVEAYIAARRVRAEDASDE